MAAPHFAFAPTATTSPAGKTGAFRATFARLGYLWLSAILVIGVSALLATTYWGFIASDQYESEMRFAVRGKESQNTDALGLLAGFSTSPGQTDGAIVADYLESRGVVEDVAKNVDLRSIWGPSLADWPARFDRDAPFEELALYWKSMVKVRLDTTSGALIVDVHAFTAKDSKRVADAVYGATEALVNQISDKARADAVKSAETDVSRSEERLKAALASLAEFRANEKTADPARKASAYEDIVSRLRGEWAAAGAELKAARAVAPGSVQVKLLKSKEQALNEELTKVRDEGPSSDASAALPDTLKGYEMLMAEKDFAERANAAAMAALDRAKTQAEEQQRYLATYVHPATAEEALYPKRILWILGVTTFATLIWGIGAFLVYAVRDHMQ